MKLSNAAINECANILNGIKINRISDKDVKLKLVKNYLEIRRASNAIVEDTKTIVEKFQDDWQEEIPKVRQMRLAGETVPQDEYKDFLEAEAVANFALTDINNIETEVNVEPIDADVFVSCFSEDEVTLDTIGYLVDVGLLK